VGVRLILLVTTCLASTTSAPLAARADDLGADLDAPADGAPGSELARAPHAHELVIGGYLQPQARLRQDDPDVGFDEDGVRVRRARLELDDRVRFGRLTLTGRVEVELVGAVELEDGFVGAEAGLPGGGGWRVDVGQLKAPVSRQALLSDARLAFVEKPALAGLAPDRQLGLAAAVTVPHAPWVTVRAGVFDGEGKNQGGNVDQRFLWAGRVEVSPLGRGVALAESSLGGDYLTVAASAAQHRFATGGDVERTRTFGADVGFGWRGISGAAEYLEVRHHRRLGSYPDYRANGVAAQLAYLLPLPGRWARRVEVAARFEEIDRNDAVPIERAGDPDQSLRSYHLAATWYQLGHDLKLQLDAAHIDEIEDIDRRRADATYRNDTVLVQATYRWRTP
jgi:hypothetical protein